MRMSHPLPNAWPVHPLHGSRSRPLFPDRLQSMKLYPILQKFRLSAAVASASARMGRTGADRVDAGRGATRRSPQREGIRQHPAPPDPPQRVLGPLRSSQMKHARGGGPAIVRQAPSMRAPRSHTPAQTQAERKRFIFLLIFCSKKGPKTGYVT